MEKSLANEWLTRLQANGYRITRARRIIVEELAAAQKVMDAVDLLPAAVQKTPSWVW